MTPWHCNEHFNRLTHLVFQPFFRFPILQSTNPGRNLSTLQALDEVTPLPLIVYNVPGRTSSNINTETILRIAHDCPNVIGIKDASGDLDQGKAILDGRPDDFIVLSGDDETAILLIQSGAEGVISVIAGGFPRFFSNGVVAALEGNENKANKIATLAPAIIDLLFVQEILAE